MVGIESLGLGTVSYSPSIATAIPVAILEIFSIKEWRDLEIWVWGRSGSLKMVRYRPCMTFYWSVVGLTIALSCTIFELFDVK